MKGSRVVCGIVLALAAGCLPPWWHTPPLDPTVTFAAHRESRGLVIDRLNDAGSAELVAEGPPWDPSFRLERQHGRTAVISSRNGRATVRLGEGASASLVGQVDAELDGGAIRFTLQPGPGEVVRTTVFHRIGAQGETLRRSAKNILEVRGEYRADLTSASGALIGWLRVRVGKYQAYTRIYDGVVPSSIDGALVAATVQLLDAEIDHLEANVPNDVYL